MTHSSTDDYHTSTSELLNSLHASVRRLRQSAERLSDDLHSSSDADLSQISRQIAAAEGLIRTCLKVETSIVEQAQQRNGIVQGGCAFDLEDARRDIGERLDRIRASGETDGISE